MKPRPTSRAIEAFLLLAVLCVMLCGLILVHAGKSVSTPYPAHAFNVNAASADDFVRALGISANDASRLVQARSASGGFTSLHALRHVVSRLKIDIPASDPRRVVRTPADVSRAFWSGMLAYIAAFLLIHLAVRQFAPDADPFLLPLTAWLSGLGLLMTYSVQDPYRSTFLFGPQAWGVALWGMLALCVPLLPAFGRLPLRRYGYLYMLATVVLLLGLLIFGHGPGGVHIQLFGFEPVELIKVLICLFAAAYLAPRMASLRHAADWRPRREDIGPIVALYGLVLLLFVLVRDLGPAVLLFGLLVCLLYLTTQRVVYPIVGLLLILGAAFIGNALHFGFFATRVAMWASPFANADPRGMQLGEALWGLSTGGMVGSGLGLGSPGVMTRSESDLIFAAIGEELGLVGSLSILCVYVLLLARGLRIARNAASEFDRLLAAGLALTLTLQAFLITAGVTGLLPLTGVTLPFVSRGASSLLACFFSIGLLLHLSAKRVPPGTAERPYPGWTSAARRVGLTLAAALLIGVGIFKLIPTQGIRDVSLASRPILVPDADGVTRPHINPRLTLYATAIPRGRILDRNGLVLARDADPADPQAIPFLTPDGRARLYAGGPACGHLLLAVERGQSDTDPFGQDAVLRGYTSYASLLPKYRARWLPFARTPQGRDVTLTIDAKLQDAALAALTHYAAQVRDRRTGRSKHRGAAVLLDAATGDALAVVSLPAFDPASLTSAQWVRLHAPGDPDNPLLNRALAGLYPPGSAFKVVTASAALMQGLDDTIVNCPHTEHNITWHFSGKPYARRTITDEEGFVPHGATDMAKALRVSCNIYFAHLALDLGPRALLQTARQGFQLSHLPTLAKIGEDLPDCGYGQGAIETTPLEMARVAQAVANGGVMLPVRIVKDGPGIGRRTNALVPVQDARLQTMLAAVTAPGGTAQGVFDSLPQRVSGKTGSAQNNQGDGETHSWFIGFAPSINPAFAFSCVVENGGFGRDAAAPVCRELLRAAL